ncbi:hypothetical protein BX600DRAFT_466668 [Xylariales sp. PMI_506]|nr:hypothetical protein BX600DRAFT_466668 [Xylariales sp. PMI_506]
MRTSFITMVFAAFAVGSVFADGEVSTQNHVMRSDKGTSLDAKRAEPATAITPISRVRRGSDIFARSSCSNIACTSDLQCIENGCLLCSHSKRCELF